MAFEADDSLVRRHAASVVNDLYECPAGIFQYHCYLPGSCIYRVLHQLLDYRRRSLHDLSRSYHVGDIAW